jgi:hypothetical protein
MSKSPKVHWVGFVEYCNIAARTKLPPPRTSIPQAVTCPICRAVLRDRHTFPPTSAEGTI